MNMRFKNLRDSHAGFARRFNVNIAVRTRIKYRCDSFIIVADQIRKLSDTFSLNGFKNERHRGQSNAKQLQTSIRSTLQSKLWGAQAASLLFSAACRKALERSSPKLFFATLECRRQAADDCRFATTNPSCGGLAACAPQKTHRTWTVTGSKWL